MPLAFRRVHTISVDQKVVISPSHICNNPLNAVNSHDPNQVHILWISYFTDKFQWYDISNTKICSKSPDFKHKITKDFLWVDAWYTPSWVIQELKRGRGKDAITVGSDNNECVAIVDLLKDCAKRKDLCKGSQAHLEILKRGLFEKSPYVGSTLVSMYAKCGALEKAKKVLKNLPIRNVISWSALISGYAQHGHGEEALNCFETMKSEGFSPDAITFTSVLNACAIMKFLDKGIDIHDEIVGKRLLGKHISLDNALIDMYAKCGALEKAQKVLDELHSRDVVSWSTLIAGFAHHGQGEEALLCYKLMQSDGISPNVVTWICVLKACGGLKALDKGKHIHNEIEKKASITGEDTVLGNALVDMYAKCDAIAEARHSLNNLRGRDVVSWSSLIAGYIQQGQNEDALMCFKEMQIEGLCPDAITFSYILKACGSIGAIAKGKEVHDEVANKGILRNDTTLGTALVDMYAKCGALGRARKVLNELSERNVATWNALISGYAQHGQGEEALECFRQMLHDGMSPDAITYVCLLNACTHSALVDEGQMCFAEMIKSYDITPNPEHYACMVNLFSRVGHFEKATDVITKIPSSDYRPLWSALLGSCQNWGKLNLGRLVFEHAMQLDGNHSASYISLSNIYATASMHDECGKA